ncbi:MAG: RNA 2',3'-cyclic phosphodiesterase [Planctomycetota bacterium]|nr:RNA 2',3'-cyclic phosphodiesterase [Planctomycetota bacterium]
MRAFLAIDFPESLKRIYAQALVSFRERFPAPRWVRPECLHLTLRFLGEIPSEAGPALQAPVARLASEVDPFPVSIADPGSFGSPREPRVYWFALREGRGRLEKMQSRLENLLREAGHAAEEKPWTPHITVARHPRDRRRGAVASASEWEAAARETLLDGARFEVTEVTLMSSTLTPAGPVYRPEWVAPLGSPEARPVTAGE